VAARERSRYMADVLKAAEASAELARRMARVGNFNKLQQAREQSFQADAVQGYARALREEMATRERLVRLLGLWGSELTALQLPERLPDLPTSLPDRPSIEREAMARRLDVQAVKLQTEQTARQLGLTRTTRFINVLELGGHLNSSNEEHAHGGWEVSLELPLFDWGTARVARAQALYTQAISRTAQTAVNARSEVREAYGHWRATHDIAKHQRDEVVPLKKRISEENLLRYNGMLIGVFELLADARSQITGVSQYLDALRDFWVADAELEMALLGPVGMAAAGSGAPGARTPSSAAPAAPHAPH
jgi:outer membrane protein TolC